MLPLRLYLQFLGNISLILSLLNRQLRQEYSCQNTPIIFPQSVVKSMCHTISNSNLLILFSTFKTKARTVVLEKVLIFLETQEDKKRIIMFSTDEQSHRTIFFFNFNRILVGNGTTCNGRIFLTRKLESLQSIILFHCLTLLFKDFWVFSTEGRKYLVTADFLSKYPSPVPTRKFCVSLNHRSRSFK